MAALCLSAMLSLGLTACGSGGDVRKIPPTSTSPRSWPQVVPADPVAANAVLMRALGLVGTPYRYGGNTPDSGFDCSGLVAYVYRDMLDLRLPRTSRELAGIQGPRIDPDKLAAYAKLAGPAIQAGWWSTAPPRRCSTHPGRCASPADLVFFGTQGNVSHVGIYVGEGRFVHAPSSGGTVRLDRLDGAYWRDHYSGAKRVLR